MIKDNKTENLMTFNQEINQKNIKTESDDVQIIEEFEASKTLTEPVTGHSIREISKSYLPTRNSHMGSEQHHSELLL